MNILLYAGMVLALFAAIIALIRFAVSVLNNDDRGPTNTERWHR